jgi:ATPase subunit of ABC transporter with duplicated ATPase domains
MPSLVCHHLRFDWPNGEPVFADLDAAFPDGVTGLVGRNGSGKSTLLRIMAKDLVPTAGSVSGPERIAYLPQQLVLHAERTVADVLGVEQGLRALERVTAGDGTDADFEAIGDRWDLEAELTATVERLGFVDLDLTRRIGTVSGGEAVLLALAGLLLAEPDVLLLDEPTNNLDPASRAEVLDAIRRYAGAVVLVTHDEGAVDALDPDRVLLLPDGVEDLWNPDYADLITLA